MGEKINVDVDDILVLLRSTSSGLDALKALIDALPDDADIGNLPWDELQAAHVAAGSFGKQIKDIKDKVDTLSAGGDATLAKQNEILTGVDANETKIDTVNTVVDAIKGKTDNLPADPADASDIAARFTTLDAYVDELESLLKNATYGLSALNTKILNIPNKDSVPHIRTYPKLAGASVLTTGDTAWAEGAWVEIVPANTITETFWIVGALWTYSTYENILELGIGASGSEVEIANVPSILLPRSDHGYIRFPPICFYAKIKVAANTRVSARVADSAVGVNAHSVKLVYITGM